MTNTFSWAVIAFILYFTAHVLRSLRFWIFLNERKLSFRLTFVTVYTTAILGYWIPVVFGEILRALVLGKQIQQYSRAIMTVAITRTLDLLLLGGLSVMMETTFRNPNEPHSALFGIGVISLLVGIILTAILSSLKVLLSPIKRLLMSRNYGKLGVNGFRLMDTLEQASHRGVREAGPVLLLGFAISCVIWTLDILAVAVLIQTPEKILDIKTSFTVWVSRSFESILSGSQRIAESAELLSSQLLLPQTIACVVIFCLFSASFFRKKGSV